jgi:hypothetical protein
MYLRSTLGLRPTATVAAVVSLLSTPVAHAASSTADFQIVSDQKSMANGAQLCLAVDRKKPLVPARGATVAVPHGGTPVAVSGAFYPVIVAECDAVTADTPSRWSFTDTRELKIVVNGTPMCLSARFMNSFDPLLDPFLQAFGAFDPGSPFAFLLNDLKKGNVVNTARLRANPDLVVSACGKVEATDFWVYDPVLGVISGPAGWDDKSPRTKQCVTMHGDWSVKPPKHVAGMPVSAANCPDTWSFRRADAPPHQRWSIAGPREWWPSYAAPDPKDYFGGGSGLPIVGPLGRCLTVDLSLKAIVTSDCDGRDEQNWKITGDVIRLGATGECLERAGDGATRLAACSGAVGQKWKYVVADPAPNPRWRNGDVYGRLHAGDNLGQCLIVANDPFADPVRQRNPVMLAPCSAALPRQTSWFRTTVLRTVRVALLRFSDDDGSNPAMANRTDDDLKRMMEDVVAALSEHYRVMGVRFVFDPEHDYLTVKDGLANRQIRGNPEAAKRIASVASNALYGKLVIVIAAGMGSGGFSGAEMSDFDPARIVQHVDRTPIAVKLDTVARDRAGLPALSYYVAEAFITAQPGRTGHHAHEVGHYFGLVHPFAPDEFADTPEDARDGSWWFKAGAITCGNPRTLPVNGKPLTPDRLNNQGYWGCNMGRARNAFTPMQLGKATWVLNNQLNRYPLVACQPVRDYDASEVECENAESLALCGQTSAYLAKRNGTPITCRSGGLYTRRIATALQSPAVLHLPRQHACRPNADEQARGVAGSGQAAG